MADRVLVLKQGRGQEISAFNALGGPLFDSEEEAAAALSVMRGWTFYLVPVKTMIVPLTEAARDD